MAEGGAIVQTAELTEADIPGAQLKESLDSHNVAAFCWWLMCRGIKASTTLRKQDLIVK